MASGSLMISMALARCGRRRMKPRSSSAMIRRCTPDLDCRLSASFISSKDGGTPVSCSRSLMKVSSSFCLLVSMGCPRAVGGRLERQAVQIRNILDVPKMFCKSIPAVWQSRMSPDPPSFPRSASGSGKPVRHTGPAFASGFPLSAALGGNDDSRPGTGPPASSARSPPPPASCRPGCWRTAAWRDSARRCRAAWRGWWSPSAPRPQS